MPAERHEPGATRVDEADVAAVVLAVLEELAAELHRRARRRRASLESRLDRDLGIDSLGRMELVLRLERRLGVRLAEDEVAAAETAADLVAAVARAGPPSGVAAAAGATGSLAVEPADDPRALHPPESVETLSGVLAWHAERHPERTHILFQDPEGREHRATYGDLWQRSWSVAGALAAAGLAPGERVALMLPTSLEYFEAFAGALLAGAVPVPLYPPARPTQVEDHLRRQVGILRCAEASVLVTDERVAPVARLLRPQVPSLRQVATVGGLRAAAGEASLQPVARRPEDLALLQFTSGSTGQPKGVTLTHRNLLANLRAMQEGLDIGADVVVSWLPLYHDMGLIGAWMGSLTFAMPLALMSPLTFLARPARWLEAVSRHRGTISAAPNFAYELCLRKVSDEEMANLDLASWRLALNGAEQVSPATVEAFCDRFAACGFRREAMTPVYGLAESALGVAFPPPGRGPRVDRVRREPLQRAGRAEPAADDDATALAFVSCGGPLADHELRIVDEAGRELPERRLGRLEFRGPSATAGYYRNPEATAALFDDGWVDSGDLAYLADGEVYPTGRVKDVVIRAGRNLYPQELEEAVGAIEGVRRGCVAVFGHADPETGTEHLVVVAETRETGEEPRERMRSAIQEAAVALTGMPADEVVLARPGSVLKTSSGKVRRSASREAYERGELETRARPFWWQLARVGLRSGRAALRAQGRRLADLGFAVRAGLALLVAAPAAIVALALPGRPLRRRGARVACRLLLRLAGLRVSTRGLESLPARSHVVASNHASYLDGFVLTAVLPPRYGFVVKRELAAHPLTRWVLARLGASFVERFTAGEGAADARRVGERAAGGECLAVFPEGTFQRAPGLLPFRMGSFTAAASAGVHVVPVVLRGTRVALRPAGFLPSRHPIEVEILPPIPPSGSGWEAALALRDGVRAAILARNGEGEATVLPPTAVPPAAG